MNTWKKTAIQISDAILCVKNQIILAGILFLCFSHGANAQFFFTTDRFFLINDDSCDGPAREIFRSSAKMWSFYGDVKIFEIENPTTDTEGKDLIHCETQEWMDETIGQDVVGNAGVWGDPETKQAYYVDITISQDWIKPCVIAHEMGHGLGLAVSWDGGTGEHPEDPVALMYAFANDREGKAGERSRPPCRQTFLTVTDLLLLAEVQQTQPNCTGYIQPDYSLYFPNVAGFEAEFVYNGQNWDLYWAAPAPKADWKCNVTWSKSQYYKGVFYITTDLFDESICLHANKCPARKMNFVLEKGVLKTR